MSKRIQMPLRTSMADLKILCGALALGIAALSCGKDSTGPVAPGKPSAVVIVSGDGQTATVGTELSAPVVVRVTDDAGTPVPGQLINFRVVSGNGSVFAGSSLTNAAGEARERWTLGTIVADDQKLEARAVDPTSGEAIVFATFHATAVAGPAASMSRASEDKTGGTAGGPPAVQPAVHIADQYGNSVSGAAVTFAVVSGGGSINGSNQASVPTNASGVATATGWVLGPSVGTNALSASVSGIAGSPISFLATANAGAPATVTISPENVSLLAYNQQLTAVTKDANGNVVTGASLTWISSNPSVATVDENGVVTAISDGTASITATTNGKTGTATVNVLPWTFSSITLGSRHTCALTGSSNTAYCWGLSSFGELGNGTESYSHVPSAVLNVTTYASLDAGNAESCGVRADGSVYCWGLTSPGPRIGNIHSTTPVGVTNGIQTVSVGGGSVCVLSAAGDAKCRGYNQTGQLGDGTTSDRSSLVPVSGGLQFSSIAVGQTTCAVSLNGTAYCWGDNRFGQVGDGTFTQRLTPTAVQGGLVFNAISTSGSHSCGLSTDGTAYCWGNNESGQLGDGTTLGDPNLQGRSTPQPVSTALKFTAVTANGAHTCASTSSGAAYCWGNNDFGQLGNGTLDRRLSPVAVQGGLLFTSISAGGGSTCGVSGGKAYCWGLNDWGQIGDGTRNNRLFPTPVRRP
jgi:alpha-tubulin suppressor-like RCC1 family protein